MGEILMALSPQKLSSGKQQRPFLRLRPTRLLTFEELEQRRTEAEQRENHYKRQVTGAYWRFVSGVHQSTGSYVPQPPPYTSDDIALQPTLQMRATGPMPKVTDKLPAYHEPCSDSFDVSSLQLPISLKTLIQASIQEHGRRPDALRLNPVVVMMLSMMDECADGRYKGVIPLVPDPELDSNTIGIDYL